MSRFNPKDVDETADWAITRIVEIERRKTNHLQLANEVKQENEQLRGYVGQTVEWKFPVSQLFADRVRLDCTWSTVNGSSYPKDVPNWDGHPERLIVRPRFTVLFRYEAKQSGYDPLVLGPAGAWTEDAGSLTIGKEISRSLSLRLKPNDVVNIRGKIDTFGITNGDGPPIFSRGVLCILTNVAVQE